LSSLERATFNRPGGKLELAEWSSLGRFGRALKWKNHRTAALAALDEGNDLDRRQPLPSAGHSHGGKRSRVVSSLSRMPLMKQLQPSQIDRIANDLVRTVHKAKWLVDAEAFGDELDQQIVRARELLAMLVEHMSAGDDWVTDELSAMSVDMGDILERLEAVVAEARL
jgi:hypothetical protein